MITFFLNEENCIRVIVIISMKGSRIRIVMLFCILDVIFSVKEIFLFYSPSPDYPVVYYRDEWRGEFRCDTPYRPSGTAGSFIGEFYQDKKRVVI